MVGLYNPLFLGPPYPWGFTLHIFLALDGTFLSGINSHSNEEDPRKNKMLGWIS
jgi:hypothetical protein